MGWYYENDGLFNKTRSLMDEGGELVSMEQANQAVVEGKGVFVIIDNGMFKAAGFAYSEQEFKSLSVPYGEDNRKREYIVMDREKAEKLSLSRSVSYFEFKHGAKQ